MYFTVLFTFKGTESCKSRCGLNKFFSLMITFGKIDLKLSKSKGAAYIRMRH